MEVCLKPGHYNTSEGCLICQGKGYPRQDPMIDLMRLEWIEKNYEAIGNAEGVELCRLARLGLEAERKRPFVDPQTPA